MGAAILGYFAARTTNGNLNSYGLTDPNYRLWMAIKIIAGNDNNLYARSLAMDQSLFA